MWFIVKTSFILSLVVLIISIILVQYSNYNANLNLEKLKKWSENNKIPIDRSRIISKPFKIEFDENEWNMLIQKLSLTKYFKPLVDAPKFEYGFDPEYAKDLIEYWRTKYDWKSRVNYLNKFPQFQININDTTIHYLHFVTNKDKKDVKKVNLLILDGWPGSFFGFYKMIDYINENYKDISYDIIVPSIPGFGYSAPLDKIVDAFDTALLFDAIMRYEHGENSEYFIHGEDWGSLITTYLAKLYPNRVKGIHITMPPQTSFFDIQSLFYTAIADIFPNCILKSEETKYGFKYGLKEIFMVLLKKGGYFHMQATTPDTLGAGLTDSPIGLLTYILEKYSKGSFANDNVIGKKDGNLEKFNRDDLLTIVTYYWMTNTITSSMRLYKNIFYTIEKGWPRSDINLYKISSKVPVAVQYFKNEVSIIPHKLLELKYQNLTKYSIVENGGHFAAFENPKISAIDFISFLKSIYNF